MHTAYIQKHKAVKCHGSPLSFAIGGQKARVVFAELACREPDVLILVSGSGLREGPKVAVMKGIVNAWSRNVSSIG